MATMRIGTIRPAAGATKTKKRRGKGAATGLGGTAGKGHKGKKARSGGKIPAWFEGGQMPLHRRVPKRGFHNPFRVEYAVVNLDTLGEVFDAGSEVTPDVLRERGIALDRQQATCAAAFVGRVPGGADAERERRVMVEEERGDVIVVDDQQRVRPLLGKPCADRLISLEDGLPDRIGALVGVVCKADRGRVRRGDGADDPGQWASSRTGAAIGQRRRASCLDFHLTVGRRAQSPTNGIFCRINESNS